ncbi:acyltransferase family protein [Undibacterium sp. SXout7W]|uniref:acyltransferase family protein n=1 Tax=Undibacterium sp. SXout7W TaxID=3413049 RepID=UPI003BF1D5AE
MSADTVDADGNHSGAIFSRHQTIDIAKGLGIFLVVLGHNWMVAHEHGELFRVIFSFHMPLFFFLSGVFLKESRRLSDFAFTKADAILKPYIVVLLCWGLLRILLSGVSWSAYLSGVIYATGNTIEWVPLWYLPHLFLSLLFVFVLLRITGSFQCGNNSLLYLSLAMLGAGVLVMHTEWPFSSETLQYWNRLLNDSQDYFPGLPWSADLIGVSAAFILAGYALKEHIVHFCFHRIYFLAALFCFVILHILFDETMDLHMRHYGQFWIVSAQAILGIYLTLSLSFLLQRCHTAARILAYIGGSTLFILIFHSWIEWKIFSLCSKYMQNDDLKAFVSLFFGLLLPLLLQAMVVRIPFLARCLLPSAKRKTSRTVLAINTDQ